MDQGSTATFRKRDQHVMCWLPSPVLGGKVADIAEERDEPSAPAEPSAVFVVAKIRQ